VSYLKVLTVGAATAAVSLVVKWRLGGSPATTLIAVAAVQAAGFALLGTLTGCIKRDDWRFVVQWLRPGRRGGRGR
jgi:hypothetical protein